MPRARTFIAIDLDKTIRNQMTVLQESLARSGCARSSGSSRGTCT